MATESQSHCIAAQIVTERLFQMRGAANKKRHAAALVLDHGVVSRSCDDKHRRQVGVYRSSSDDR